MPSVHEWHSRGRELSAPDHDPTGIVALSSTVSGGEHLKQLVFVLLRWLDSGGCPLRREAVSSVVRGQSMASGGACPQ